MLDTRYGALDTQLAPALAREPLAVLMIGVAARRRRICVESRAVNRMSGCFPMRAARSGRDSPSIPVGRPKVECGGAAVRVALRRAGLAAAPSRDAGRYLCNASYFRALEEGRPVVFLHPDAAAYQAQDRRGRAPPAGSRRWAEVFTEAARVLALRGRAGAESAVHRSGDRVGARKRRHDTGLERTRLCDAIRHGSQGG